MAADAGGRKRTCMDDGGGGMAALPEHVLIEVLSRVGSVKDLFRLAVTCRWCARLFTDPAFLRGLCPLDGEGHRARLLGFFITQKARFKSDSYSASTTDMQTKQHTTSPTFIPVPGSPLSPTDRTLTSDDGAFNCAEPLAARHGMVLMQLVPPESGYHFLGICNPITGERHVLSWPLRLERSLGNDKRGHGYAIIAASDIDGLNDDGKKPPSFSQLLVADLHGRDYKLHSYSAATRRWSYPPAVCANSYDHTNISMVGAAVVHRGAAHWLCVAEYHSDYNLYMLSAELMGSTTTTRASFRKLPVRGGGVPLLCVTADGKLGVASVYMAHVTVWTQQQGGGGGGDDDGTPAAWVIHTAFQIPSAMNYPNLTPPEKQPKEQWFDLGKGSMLGVHRSRGVFVLDLEKKVAEKVMDGSLLLPPFGDDKGKGTIVPYEMDLVDSFVLRLHAYVSTKKN